MYKKSKWVVETSLKISSEGYAKEPILEYSSACAAKINKGAAALKQTQKLIKRNESKLSKNKTKLNQIRKLKRLELSPKKRKFYSL